MKFAVVDIGVGLCYNICVLRKQKGASFLRKLRILSLLLAVSVLFAVFAVPMEASASVDLSGTTLTTHQKYFLRVLGSLSRADYYQNDILASITLAQAIYEGGWGRYSLPVGGCNLFGIKAYNTWSGMVYDQNEHILYKSYEDFVITKGQSYINKVSAWRAHENWAESVDVHSALFINESKYAAVVGEKDYKVMAKAIVDAGYCNDNGYADTVVALIEQYGLTEYDNLTPDEDGVVAVVTRQERKHLNIGESFAVPLTYYPSTATSNSVTWASDNPAVATVDQEGNVTAVAHGKTLITATLANGREACCIVYVDCNATVIEDDVTVYTSPTSTSTYDKIYRGEGVKVTSSSVYVNANGENMLAVTGYNRKGALVSGYVLAEKIYMAKRNVSQIAVVKDNVTLKVNDTYKILVAVSPADAVDTVLSYTTSDSSVATVSPDGTITAKKLGSATITMKTAGGVSQKIAVTVANAYREYNAIVSAYEVVNVRSEADSASTRVGTIPFLSQVTVIGEPVGKWIKIKGATGDGKVITGYADSAYIRILADGTEVKFANASSSVAIYSEPSIDSTPYGTLLSGSEYAIIETLSDDWCLIIGIKSTSSGVYGYSQIKNITENPTPTPSDTAWYGRTTSDLYVRKGAGSSYGVVGKFLNGTDIVISGEENGWYKVSGKSNEGNEISGYSSASYIITLYTALTTSKLRLRESDTTDSAIVTTLELGTEVVVVGEILESGWYMVEYGNYKGYCSGAYIAVNGKLPAQSENTDPPEEGFGITDSSLSIKNGILYGVSANTTVSSLLNSFKGNVTVTDAAGKTLASSSKVGTGCLVKYTSNGVVNTAATVLVMGDTNGDGALDSFDALALKAELLGTSPLNGVYKLSVQLCGESELCIVDYVILKRAIFGYTTI